jgi:hypothetical protein
MLSEQHRLQRCNFFTHGEAERDWPRCRKGEGCSETVKIACWSMDRLGRSLQDPSGLT